MPPSTSKSLVLGAHVNVSQIHITILLLVFNCSRLLHSGLPGPCKEIVASEITKSSCKVSWDLPDFDGGTPIIHYVLQVGQMVLFL